MVKIEINIGYVVEKTATVVGIFIIGFMFGLAYAKAWLTMAMCW